jgi:hypothetical protein
VALAVAWAVVGVLGGHLATYAILFPDAHVHDRVLDQTGHGWTVLLWPAALTAVTVALVAGWLTASQRGRGRGVRFGTLFVLQVALFAGLELSERVAASGLSLASLEHHLVDHGLAGILVLGTAIQVATAWLGSAISRAVAAVAAARRSRARPRRRPSHRRQLPIAFPAPRAAFARAHRSRAPPAASAIRSTPA